jgi:hypothetical protein
MDEGGEERRGEEMNQPRRREERAGVFGAVKGAYTLSKCMYCLLGIDCVGH